MLPHTHSSLQNNLSHRILRFLFQQSYLPPIIFFAFIIIKELGLPAQAAQPHYTLFYVGVAFFAVTCFNHFFFYSSVLTSSIGLLGPYNLLLGILASNQIWKVHLFWFSIAYYFVQSHEQFKQMFIVTAAVFICVRTYTGLIFSNVIDNVWFFTGFFALGCVHLYSYILKYGYGFDFHKIQRACIAPVLIFLGYIIIKMRILKLKRQEPRLIKNPTVLIQYMNLLIQEFKQKDNIHCYVYMHKQWCKSSQCYCHKYSEQKLIEIGSSENKILLRQATDSLFMESFEHSNWEMDDRLIIIHKYAQFLIQTRQYPTAITILTHSRMNTMNYFNKCDNFRVRQQLELAFSKLSYFDDKQIKLRYIYHYDLRTGFVNKEIKEVLADKIEFWKQLCEENPRVKKLQITGRKLVNRIENLHEYFMQNVRPCEEYLSTFKCSIVYAIYLLMTTNYTQFANSIIKKTQKTIEQTKTLANYGMQFGLFLKAYQNFDSSKNNLFDLIIDNISTSFAQSLKQNKQKLLFNDVSCIIPDQFKEIHNNRSNNFLKFNSFSQSKSHIIGQNIQLPFKINNQQVIFLHMSSSLRYDPISNCAVFQCVLKKLNNNTINFIVDLDGELEYQQNDIFKEYSAHGLAIEALARMKQKWQSNQSIEHVEVKTQEGENLLSFSLDPLYPHLLKSFGFKPLVKLTVKSDSFKTQKLRVDNLQANWKSNQVKGLDQKANKQNDSQTSTSSLKDSIQNVLSVLMESSSLKMESFLTITLLLLLVIAIISFLVCFNVFNVWNTEFKLKSPTFTVISLINMKNSINTAISWKLDEAKVLSNSTASIDSLLAQLYPNKSISGMCKIRFGQLLSQQTTILDNYLLGADNEVSIALQDLMSKTLPIRNSQIGAIQQQMSLQSLLINFLVDTTHLYEGQAYSNTLLSFAYLQQFYMEMTSIIDELKGKLYVKLQSIRNCNIIMICLITLLLFLFIVPLWKFNVATKKKHVKIYGLLASIEAKLIYDQIKKLGRMQDQIFVFAFTPVNSGTINQSKDYVTSLQRISDYDKLAAREKEKEREMYIQMDKEKEKEQNTNTANLAILLNGMKKLTAEEVAHVAKNQLNVKIRKRAGEINPKDSDCDKKKFILRDWIAILFILTFIGTVHTLFWQKLSFIDQVEHHFGQSLFQMGQLEETSVALLNSKIFMDRYTNDSRVNFLGKDVSDWIKQWIVNYNSTSVYSLASQIEIKKCVINSLFCKLSYSEKILQSLIKKSIVDSFKWKQASLQAQLNESQMKFYEKSRYQLFFSQSLMDYLKRVRTLWLMDYFNALETSRRQSENRQLIIQIVFWVQISIFCVFSVLYTISIKRRYVKEVTLLSILNKQMLYNNKRVESFIHKLSKGSG